MAKEINQENPLTRYLPIGDKDLNFFVIRLLAFCQENKTKWKIDEETLALLIALYAEWTTAFEKAQDKENRTKNDVKIKNDVKVELTKAIRKLVNYSIAYSPYITNAERAAMGVVNRPGSKTQNPVPAQRPLIKEVNTSIPMQHSIVFVDKETEKKGKPEGVFGCEIWYKLGGDSPIDEAELTFVATATKAPYTLPFNKTDKGKCVYYSLRWVNSKGQWGPWSDEVTAIIP